MLTPEALAACAARYIEDELQGEAYGLFVGNDSFEWQCLGRIDSANLLTLAANTRRWLEFIGYPHISRHKDTVANSEYKLFRIEKELENRRTERRS